MMNNSGISGSVGIGLGDTGDTTTTIDFGPLTDYTSYPWDSSGAPINTNVGVASGVDNIGTGFNWSEFNTILSQGLNFGKTVLSLQPGVTTYSGPQGSYTSVAAPGQQTPSILTGGISSMFGSTAISGSSMIWLLGGGLLLLMMFSGKK